MTKPRCSIDGCDKPSRKRGWCDMHYWRWKRHGETGLAQPGKRGLPAPTLWERVDKGGPGGCWIWTGLTNPKGYGYFKKDKRRWQAHRHFYTELVGPIPDGLQIDHLCKVTSCVNPEHLEPVTPRENLLRSDAAGAIALRTNRCKRGHEFTPENTYRRPSHPDWRMCRACRRAREAAE